MIGVGGLAAVLLMDYDDKATKDSATRVEGGWRPLFTASLVGIYAVRGLYIFNLIFRSNFLPIYLHESPRFNASETQIGTYMTLIRLAVAGSQAALGNLCDRYGARRMIVASVSVMGATYLGLSLWPGPCSPLHGWARPGPFHGRSRPRHDDASDVCDA